MAANKYARKTMKKMQHEADPHKPAHGNEPPSYKAEGPPRAGKGAHKSKKKGY